MSRTFVVHLRPSVEGSSLVVGEVNDVKADELREAYTTSIAPSGVLSPGHAVLVVEEVKGRKPKAV